MICAFSQFPKAHQRREPFCAFKLGALGKNPKAQARSFGCFSMAHQRRNAAARRCAVAPLARRCLWGTEQMTDASRPPPAPPADDDVPRAPPTPPPGPTPFPQPARPPRRRRVPVEGKKDTAPTRLSFLRSTSSSASDGVSETGGSLLGLPVFVCLPRPGPARSCCPLVPFALPIFFSSAPKPLPPNEPPFAPPGQPAPPGPSPWLQPPAPPKRRP
jgi:hypothetical protein